jgi:hypothetical protein
VGKRPKHRLLRRFRRQSLDLQRESFELGAQLGDLGRFAIERLIVWPFGNPTIALDEVGERLGRGAGKSK